jgi:hypothetical protein
VITPRTTKRLVQLFERELRELDAEIPREASPPKQKKVRVSGELDTQVVEFAAEIRKNGSTPEQMLVELKSLLARVAPEVPASQRSKLVATVTGRAIDAFFDGKPSRSDGKPARNDGSSSR